MKNFFRKFLYLPAVWATALFVAQTASASHVPGGNITYECVGPNQYAITLTLFEDCGTAFESNGNQTITITNDCGITGLTSLTLTNTIFQQEVSQLCPAQIGQSECNGGTLPGVWMHQWTGIVTLPDTCDSWTFAYSSCCRNTSINSPNQDSYYWESTLNNADAPCNTSAQITSQPIPYVCANQPVNFNMSALDPDGNTLVFSLIPAMTSATGTITYNPPYTGAVPITGITINSATGQINFTPTVLGNFIVAVLIEEYDANGNLVGSVVQDFQFEVITCTNQVPSQPAGGITNYTGGGVQTSANSIQVCEGDSFCFDLTFSDSDPSNVLTVTSNIATSFPGATITITGTNPVTAHVCHTVASGAPPVSIISFDVEDDACPIPGINSYPITISVINSTYAGMDEIICLNQGVQLQANGGSNFVWTVISGTPINPGNFSCTNCPDPIANPPATTTYMVTSNLTGGCDNIDTVTVTVVPDFTYTITQSSTQSCLMDPISVNVTTNPTGAFNFVWSPGTYLNTTTGPNITITATAPGTYGYNLSITSPDGCVKTDHVNLTVAAAYAPTPTATTMFDTLQCGGGTTVLSVDLGGGVPATCGLSTSGGCSGNLSNISPGTQTGANTTTSYPAIWGNWYKSGHTQMLFTAAELNAMGFIGGKIIEMDVPVTAINGTALYKGVTIQMGCTNITQFGSGWETGLTTVFGPQNVPIAVGSNIMAFTTPYEWDGVSNLIVDICSDNTSDPSYTQNSITPQTTTAGLQCQYLYQDFANACGTTYAPSWGSPSTTRPKVAFTTCPSVPDTTQYSYSWTPSASVAQPNNLTTNASPNITTNYTVTVTNNNGGCTGTSSVMVVVDCLCFPPDPIITNVSCNGASDGAVTANMVGTTGPWTVNWYNSGGTLIQTTNGVTVSDAMTGLAAGTYTIEIIDTALCQRDTVITITQPPVMSVNAGQDQIICLSNSATMTAVAAGGNGAPYTYSWSNGGTGASITDSPLVQTCYDVTATDAMGCVSPSDQVCIFVNPPIIGTVSQNDTICPGETANITASAIGGNGGPYNYAWSLNGVAAGNGTNINVTPTVSPSTYMVIITDNCGTPADTQYVSVYHYAVPQPNFTADLLGSCAPLVTNFTNTTNPALVGSVVWDFGDGTTSTQSPTVQHTFSTPNCYDITLTVESINGCVGDTTFSNYVCAWPYPVADFIFGPQPTNLFNTLITFNDMSSSDAITWNYDIAGLSSSTDPNPQFEFPNDNPNNYDVTLIVTNNYGCADTTINTVVIQGIYTIYAPNSFTPNGDGRNDIFYVLGEGFDPDAFDFYIFDRWGELIFHSESMANGWDGMYKNVKAKNDVYVWKIKSKDIWTGKKYETYGHVTLIR
ncbi:MAG: gliding motility-associated C-terminal domain-containing protein [Flavobacteriales bacterium]|nr:gliding motility-associated C-terminal domain-containing protein [Flavobacteriales bacterium]